ncbi:putative F-box protein [Vitis vinifera]|uniref:Putative F-box protein n=1 Tax=Vitis vinifera TaxID=29760 RepID=A0A438JLJ0_VITVI|nr:putative F-box protein [Vitis vinifera]
MGKRMRREKSICCCNSPLAGFSWCLYSLQLCEYEEDIWTEIAKHLDGKSLVMLGTTNKWFHCLIMEDSIWKFACLRDLQLPEPQHTFLNWIKLYASAFDGSHSFMFRQREKHIGNCPFLFTIGCESNPIALLAEKLSCPLKIPQGENLGKTLESCGFCILNNIKTGIWIADLQLVRCPVCDLNTCDGKQEPIYQ